MEAAPPPYTGGHAFSDDGNRPPADEGNHSGQVRMAYRLAAAHTDRLLHVHSIGWHYWDGARWREDDTGQATRAVVSVIAAAIQQALLAGDKELLRDVRRCESAAAISGVLAIASALPEFAVTVADLDADPYLLNVANGTLDLRTLTLDPHDPRDRITKVARAAYRPGAPGPVWDAFLARVLPDEDVRAFLQRYVGLGVCGQVLEHVLAIATGEGANGKSVTVNAIDHALGDYAIAAEPDMFLHRDGGHPTGEMDLRGVRWATVQESDKGKRLAEATVKRLTGGDRIKARRMRQDFVEFTPSHTALMSTNHLPKVSGDDPALWRRLRVIPYAVTVPPEERDSHLTEKLQLEADAVLAWAVAGWEDYRARGLAEPEAVIVATDSYQRESDGVARFLAERTMPSPVGRVKFADLWEAWCQWAAGDGADVTNKKQFSQDLDRHGYPEKRTGTARLRSGLVLLAEENDDH